MGPRSVAESKGSPTTSASIASVKRARNSSAISSTTMKRLAAMHDCPLFCTRAVTAVRTVDSMSADGRTMNGSEPPSSSTLFFSAPPAAEPTEMPARSLPVRVTAAIRGSSISAATSLDSTNKLVNTPSGRPARRNRSSMARAVCGTLEACLRRPTLPTMRAGAAKRITCHIGKFHGMTARTAPIG